MESALMSIAYALAALLSILLLVFIGLCVYIYFLHWKYGHLPGPPRPSFIYGHIPIVRKEIEEGRTLTELFQKWSLEYDGLYLIWFFWKPRVVVYHKDIIKDVMIKYNLPKQKSTQKMLSDMFGARFMKNGLVSITNHDEWKKKRNAANPAFYRSHLKTLVSDYNNSCDKFLNKIGEMADGKTQVRMLDYFHRVTLDVIGKVAFGVEMNAIEDENPSILRAISLSFQGLMIKLRGPSYKFMPSTFKLQREAADAVRFLRDSGKKIFEQRNEAIGRGEAVPSDILSTLIKLTDSNMITTEDLIDQVITFFTGGQETTANILSFLLLEVTQHPEIMKKLIKEIETVLGSRDYVEFDDLAKLQYMGQVLKETLRLYPTMVFIPRITNKEILLNGHVIPVNTEVTVSVFAAQRHPAHFEDPEKFDPDRWSPENSNNIPRYGFLPFSLGPRNCIGQVFAQFEAKVLLARFLNKFRVTLSPGQTRAIVQEATIRPRDGVVCTLVKR